MSSSCWWELLEVSSAWQVSHSPVPWPVMSSLLSMRQKIKAHCSIHTCVHTAGSPLRPPQAMPALASKWHRRLLQASFLPKTGTAIYGCQFSIHLPREGPACWGAIAANHGLLHSCSGCSFHRLSIVPLLLLILRAGLATAHYRFSYGSCWSPV